MKTLNAFFFLFLSISLLAQNDNYCPCQETESRYETLFEWSVQLHENRKPVNLPPKMQNPPPTLMQEPVIVPVSIPREKTIEEPEEIEEPQIDESRLNVAPERISRSGSSISPKIKKKTKWFKPRLKKRKKAKKYKGKCPAF